MQQYLFLFTAIALTVFPGCSQDWKKSPFKNWPSLLNGHTESRSVFEVKLDKRSVCMNEEVTISLNTAGRYAKPNLMYSIGGKTGDRRIMKYGTPGTKKILVLVKDYQQGEIIQQKTVEVIVEDCVKIDTLSFQATPDSKNNGIYSFTINENELPNGSYLYTWEFGDDSTLETSAPRAAHDYRKRKQDRMFSTFTVSVTATNDTGYKLSGSRTISLPNLHFMSSAMGSPTLPAIYDRFPMLNGDYYTTGIEINNIYEYSVEFTEAVMTCYLFDGSPCSENNYYNAEDILDHKYIPETTIDTLTVRLKEVDVPPGTGSISLILTGQLFDDQTVTARILLDIPPKQIEYTAGTDSGTTHKKFPAVQNRVLIRNLEKAQELLGTGRPITPSDLSRLERE